MAGYEFKQSGVVMQSGFGPDVTLFFEDELFERAQALIEDLAVATGNSAPLDPGKITGSFCIVFERDHDGNGLIGLAPAAPISADIINNPPAPEA